MRGWAAPGIQRAVSCWKVVREWGWAAVHASNLVENSHRNSTSSVHHTINHILLLKFDLSKPHPIALVASAPIILPATSFKVTTILTPKFTRVLGMRPQVLREVIASTELLAALVAGERPLHGVRTEVSLQVFHALERLAAGKQRATELLGFLQWRGSRETGTASWSTHVQRARGRGQRSRLNSERCRRSESGGWEGRGGAITSVVVNRRW